MHVTREVTGTHQFLCSSASEQTPCICVGAPCFQFFSSAFELWGGMGGVRTHACPLAPTPCPPLYFLRSSLEHPQFQRKLATVFYITETLLMHRVRMVQWVGYQLGRQESQILVLTLLLTCSEITSIILHLWFPCHLLSVLSISAAE